MSQYNRPPPAGQDFYPPRSAWHFDDWQTALPGDIYVRTWCAPVHVDPHRHSPPMPMSPHSGEREQPAAARDRPKRRGGGNGNNSRGGDGSGQSRGESARDGEHPETQVVPSVRSPPQPKPKPDTAADRERRLVELRLLLKQLYTQLEAAFNFYQPIVQEYRQETQQLGYAKKETLDRIWSNKLQAAAKKGDDVANTEDFDVFITQVGLCLRHLKSAKAENLHRCSKSGDKDAIIEKEIAAMVAAVERVMELARDAKTDAEVSESLVTQLDRAWRSSDINSSLWKTFLRKSQEAEGHEAGLETGGGTDEY